jgi:hypothetical protein
VRSSVIAEATLPHAPQLFGMPETQDRDAAVRVKGVAHEIGSYLKTRWRAAAPAERGLVPLVPFLAPMQADRSGR